jgi:hypothetical protein
MSLAGAGLANAFGGGNQVADLQRGIGQLMDELGVDGVIMAMLNADGMSADDSNLILFVRQPGVMMLRPAWQGMLKKGKVKFEPVIAKPHSDDERVQNLARVYQHSFELLVAKLASDSK